MISKKMMIIGGSIAGAAVVTTAIVVPVVLTSSHGSSTPSIDEDKLPKIEISKIDTTSRDVSFHIKLTKTEDSTLIVKKMNFYIREEGKEEITDSFVEEIDENRTEFDVNTYDNDNTRTLKSDTKYEIYYSLILEDGTKVKEKVIADFTTESESSFGYQVVDTPNDKGIKIDFNVDSPNNDDFYNPKAIYVEILEDDKVSIAIEKQEITSKSNTFVYDSINYKELGSKKTYYYNIYYDDNGDDISSDKPKLLVEMSKFTTDNQPRPQIIIENDPVVNSRDISVDIKVKQPVADKMSSKLDHDIEKISFRLVDENGKEVKHGKIEDQTLDNQSEKTFNFSTIPDPQNDDYIRRLKADSTYSLQVKYSCAIAGNSRDWYSIKSNIKTTPEENGPSIPLGVNSTSGCDFVNIDFTVEQPTRKRSIFRSDKFYHAEKVKVQLLNADGSTIDDASQEFNIEDSNNINARFDSLEEETKYKYRITYNDYGNQFDSCVGSFGENGEGEITTTDNSPILNDFKISSNSRDINAQFNIKQPNYDSDTRKSNLNIATKISVRLTDEDETTVINFGKMEKNLSQDPNSETTINFNTAPNPDDMVKRLEPKTMYHLQIQYTYSDGTTNEWEKIGECKTLAKEDQPVIENVKVETQENILNINFDVKQTDKDAYYQADKVKVKLLDGKGTATVNEQDIIVNNNKPNIEYRFDQLEPETDYKYKITYDDKGDQYNGFTGSFGKDGEGSFTSEKWEDKLTKPSFVDTGFIEIPYDDFSPEGFEKHQTYNKIDGAFEWKGNNYSFDANGIILHERDNLTQEKVNKINSKYDGFNQEYLEQDRDITDSPVHRFKNDNLSKKFNEFWDHKQEYYNESVNDKYISEKIYTVIDNILIKNNSNETINVKLNKGYEFDYFYDQVNLEGSSTGMTLWVNENAYELEVLEDSTFEGKDFIQGDKVSLINYEYWLDGYWASLIEDHIKYNYQKTDIIIDSKENRDTNRMLKLLCKASYNKDEEGWINDGKTPKVDINETITNDNLTDEYEEAMQHMNFFELGDISGYDQIYVKIPVIAAMYYHTHGVYVAGLPDSAEFWKTWFIKDVDWK